MTAEQEQIIARLYMICERFGTSITALASRSGIAPSNISKMIKGEQNITDRTIRKVAATYGISYGWLKDGEGEMIDANSSVHQMASGENISQSNNSNNTRNSTELFAKALDEIAAQRRLTERTQEMLEEAHCTIKELTHQVIKAIKKDE